MPGNPTKSILSCLVLAISLYGLILKVVLSSGPSSSSNVGDILSSIFEPLILLATIFPIYAVITIATAWWLYASFRTTKPKRDSEARVLGFFAILLIVPHVAVVLATGVFWIFG